MRRITKATKAVGKMTLTFDDGTSVRLPMLASPIELPRRLAHRIDKHLCLLPCIVGCYCTNATLDSDTPLSDIDILPDVLSILRHAKKEVNGKTLADIDKGPANEDPFVTIKRIGHEDVAKSYTWIFRNYKKHGAFSQYGPALTAFMMDTEATLDELVKNPYVATYKPGTLNDHWVRIDAFSTEPRWDISHDTRLDEALRFHLKNIINDGHTSIPLSQIVQLIRSRSVHDDIKAIDVDSFVARYSKSEDFVIEGDHVYLQHIHNMESAIVETVHRLIDEGLNGQGQLAPLHVIDDLMSEFETVHDKSLNLQQKEAISNIFCRDNISIVNGPGGTGKSLIVLTITYICEKLKLKIELAAPTGKASCRLGPKGKTLHRLLTIVEQEDGISKSYPNAKSLSCDILAVDEVSMLDLQMSWFMMKALKQGTKLVLFGDANQLPSVRYGNVLSDMLASEVVPTTTLTKVYRQGRESTILKVAKCILDKKLPPKRYLDSQDVKFVEMEDESDIQQFVLQQYLADKETVIIIPTKKRDVGTECINQLVRNELFPGVLFGYEVGMKVICVKNTYVKDSDNQVDMDKSTFNGQVGEVTTHEVKVKSDKFVGIRCDDDHNVKLSTRSIDLAYALTVHKVQGSEYEKVVLVLHKSSGIMLCNEILYTAVTRAKKMLTIVGDLASFRKCVMTSRAKRHTRLGARLAAAYTVTDAF